MTSVEITAKEYVRYGVRGKADIGLANYTMPKQTALDKPLSFKIRDGKKKTFLDDVMKSARLVPAAKYDVTTSLVDKTHKSGLPKGKRCFMTDDIIAF